jgi:hypothetical protein
MQHVLSDRQAETSLVFVVRVGARACAFPLHHVAETMRPLPIVSVAGMSQLGELPPLLRVLGS